MKTYSQVFKELNRPALIPFFVLGDPDTQTSFDILKTAIDSGADILELGIPFSDPIADGPTIQKADIRALNNGMTVEKALKLITEIKRYKDIPIGLLMYYNLIYQYGVEKFFFDFQNAGVNSVLVADLSVDDADEIVGPAKASGMDTVFMVTPITENERIKRICQATTGFIYTVSLLGVTGSRNQLSLSVGELIQKLKNVTSLPICVGFGVSSAQHAVDLASAGADGVIIGSKIVQIVEENLDDKEKMLEQLTAFITEIKKALEMPGSINY